MRIAVTGAAGSLGRQVVHLLAEQTTAEVVALTRRHVPVPSRAVVVVADYDDRDALSRALTDVDTLVFISSDGEGTRVLAHHLNIVAAARDGGVAHIVALSGIDADIDSPFCYAITNGLTEQVIRDSGCGFSIARASIFTEFFAHFILPARTTGQLRLSTGGGRISLVSKADVGHCLAALAQTTPTGRCHDLTGPVALDAAGIATTAAQAWNRPVVHRLVTPAEHMAELAAVEDPWWTYAYTSMFVSIREHRWDRVTGDVAHLIGRPPRTLLEILTAPRSSDDANLTQPSET